MKKVLTGIFAVAIAFCSICNNALAQGDQQSKSTGSQGNFIIGLTGGFSAPFGNFTKTDFYDPHSGFAGQGFNFGVTGTWLINKSFGISALVSYHGYSIKGIQVMADNFKDAFDIDSSTVNSVGNNYTMNFLIGPSFSLPLGKRLSFDSRLLAGLVNAHLAGNQVLIEDQAASTFTQKEAIANTFGLQAGIGVRYGLSKHFGLSLNVDYFYSKPDFDITYENRNNNAGRWITNYNEPINGINANLALVYSLHNQ